MLDKTTATRLEDLRKAGKKIVFTNGCFDILHIGHARYLAEARKLGDALFLGLNSDSSVKKLKGADRPIFPQSDRKELLLSLRVVDFVALFEEETPLNLIKEVRPDFLVKGGDWAVEKIVGYDFVSAYGGTVLSLPFVEGKSTTSVIERIRQTI